MRRRRILYIEDDADQMALVRSFLEGMPGVRVDVCATEAGAEALLNTSCYDLIICDYSLPGAATGAMIADQVLRRDPEQPFYLMSEYIGENVKAEAARVGLELHGKFSTVPPEEFRARVTELLKKRPCVTAPAAAIGDSDDRDHHGTHDDASSSMRDQPAAATSSSAEPTMRAIGSSNGTAGAAEGSVELPIVGNYRYPDRGHQVRSLRPIKLTSPHVLAARMALGRT